MFVSTHRLYEFVKQATCTFEKGIVHMMTGQLLVYFTETGYHRETRGCVMDFCENRSDIIEGLKRKQLCKECSGNIKNPRLARAVGALLLDEIRV
jgi:predicted Zn-dependent protease